MIDQEVLLASNTDMLESLPIREAILFIAYAVINDGSTPGERTGDGAFIVSTP